MSVVPGYGDLLTQEVEALVNTVNTVGVMGKGIALQFKRRWPANFRAYKAACDSARVRIGSVFIFDNGIVECPRYIVNFPTKEHWRANSRLEDIRDGLKDLVAQVTRLNIRSIAIPPLGCGNGGLQWADVEPLIREAFASLPDVEVRLFAPENVKLRQLVPEQDRPRMTPGRAAIIAVLRSYRQMLYPLSMIEVQKLTYFLCVAGEPLKLSFVKDQYGPYTDALRHVLLKMDGAYITGVGDLNSRSEIKLIPDVVKDAIEYLEDGLPETLARVGRVAKIIEGYETPYGMELLATVHWAAHEATPATSLSELTQRVHSWNERKRQTMPANEIASAYKRLASQGWVTSFAEA